MSYGLRDFQLITNNPDAAVGTFGQ